jgi:acetylornithine deacetylase
MSIPIDRAYLVSTLTDLVRINSINPTLVPGGAGETEIGEYVAGALARAGLDVRKIEPEPGRPSIVGVLEGARKGRSLMLNAHYDTVGVDGMREPFSAAIRDGKLYGRGAYDMKGSLAACMTAAKALTDSRALVAGSVVVAAVADEEYGSLGTAAVIPEYKTDGAIVTEPTALEVCLAHKGYLWIEVEVAGRAAHGSKFELGIDANMKMGHFLAKLSDLEHALRLGALVVFIAVEFFPQHVDNRTRKCLEPIKVCNKRCIELSVGDSVDARFAVGVRGSVPATPGAIRRTTF